MQKTAGQNTQEKEDSRASGCTPSLERLGKKIGGVLGDQETAFRAT